MLKQVCEDLFSSSKSSPAHENKEFEIAIEAQRELADIRAREGDLDTAVNLLSEVMMKLGSHGSEVYPAQWRRVVERLAWINFRKSNLEEAYNLADLVLLDEHVLQLEDPITLASLYNTIGGIYWTRSRFQEAIESVQLSLEVHRNINYQWGIAIALTNLGVLYYTTGKWSEAVNCLEKADQLQTDCGFDPERATNLKIMGEMLIAMGDFTNARSKLNSCLEISERLGMEIYQVYAELGLGRLSIYEGQNEEATIRLNNANKLVKMGKETGDLVFQVTHLKAQIEEINGNLTSALEIALQAQQLAVDLNEKESEIDVSRLLGIIYVGLQNYEQAEVELLHASDLATKSELIFQNGCSLADLGRLYLAWSADEQDLTQLYLRKAEINLDKAIQILRELGAQYELIRAQTAKVQISVLGQSGKQITDHLDVQVQAGLDHAQMGFPQGEWYQAVVLTILLSPHQEEDEELIFESTQMIIPNLVKIINENGGLVQLQQDGIIAVYGIPNAHENDAELGIETAVQLLNFYNMLYSQTSLPITLRLGISMGKIVAGSLQSSTSIDFLAAGETLQASRVLAESCIPARAWVTSAVRNATSFRFEYTPVSAALVELLTEAEVYELSGLREQIFPIRGLIGLKTPFIGRKDEINLMKKLGQSLAAGKGGIIWLEGEPGIGKSRLMHEFSLDMANQGVLVWRGSCTPRNMEVAFSLFSDMLSNSFDIQPSMAPELIYDLINKQLLTWPSDLSQTRPFLELLIGVQPSVKSYDQIVSLEPEQLRRQTFVALHRVISRLIQEKPLIIMLDDVQWIDSISADLLLYLSHLVISSPVLFLCAQRYRDSSTNEQTLQRVRGLHPERYEEILLTPLSLDERTQLLNEFLSAAKLPDSVRNLIIQQSGGNPYFIEEFVRMLIEQDYLRVERGRLAVNQDLRVDSLSIPSSLETLIRSRVDSLPISSRRLLQVASVLGFRFHCKLLNQIMDRSDTADDLQLLQSRGMLNQADEFGYIEFSHPMIETIVYNTLLRAQRKIIHNKTGVTLEDLWHGQVSEHAEELAYHYGQAEQYGKALFFLVLAAERAAVRHANTAAISYFERAYEMLGVVPDADFHLRWRISTGMGEVYQFIGNYEASLSTLRSGEELVQHRDLTSAQCASIYRLQADTYFKMGDPDNALLCLAKAIKVLGEPGDDESASEAAHIFTRMGWSYFIQSSLDNAQHAVEQGVSYASRAGDRNSLAAAENLLGGIFWRQRNLEQALDHTRQAMAFWQEIGYSWGVAVTLNNLGILEIISGAWAQAFETINESMLMRKEMGDVEGVTVCNLNLGFLTLDQGKFELSEEYFRNSLAISRPFRINFPAANSCLGLARTLIAQGKLDDVASVLQEGLRLANEINARDVVSEIHRAQAELYMAQGDLEMALEEAQISVTLAKESGSDLLQANASRLIANCKLELGQIDGAFESLQSARQALEKAPDILETARIDFLTARVYQARKS